MGRDGHSTPTGGGRGKVARLIEKYDLGRELGDELVDRWTGTDAERMSLRELATLFNRNLLEAALRAQGEHPHQDELRSYYDRLNDGETSAGERVEVEYELSNAGVDVEELEADFVSYQSINTYVKSRGAEYDHADDATQVERDAASVQRLRSRLESVVTERLDRLERTDRIGLGEYSLYVGIDVYCEDCERKYSFAELLEGEGCDCR
ncbi:rod-determining factor RdfA [Haloarchaeobius sp. DFWS5]|uniref:rod-determining factor RdfA n=1 Tax=Haloarchaeobius sp. DFWS5 TaxID=3446114 RepID=UPI003EB6EF02